MPPYLGPKLFFHGFHGHLLLLSLGFHQACMPWWRPGRAWGVKNLKLTRSGHIRSSMENSMRRMMYLCKFMYILYIYWKDILFFQSSKKERVGLVVGLETWGTNHRKFKDANLANVMRVTMSKTLTRVTRITIFHWPTLGNVQIEFTPPWLLFFFGSKSFQASGSARRFFSVLFISSRSLPISFNKQIPSQAAISLKQLGSSSSLRPLHQKKKRLSPKVQPAQERVVNATRSQA